MKMSFVTGRECGITLVEVLVVVAAVLLLMYVFFPRTRIHNYGPRITCVNNLMQIDNAYRIWEGDHGNEYPMAVSETNGGTMEFDSGVNAFRHFEVMSNELTTPKVLICPAETDRHRFLATNFNINNFNISYFVGIVANDTNPILILSGDRNITNGTIFKNGVLELTTNRLAGWTSEMHNKVGNIGLADGSVQEVSISGLQNLIANTGVATNWLQMPVLGQ